MRNDADDFDFSAALSDLKKPPTRVGQTLKGRLKNERKKLDALDRRALQVTGRTDQLNVRVRPMMGVEFKQYAAAQGLLPTELFERVWEHYKSSVGI